MRLQDIDFGVFSPTQAGPVGLNNITFPGPYGGRCRAKRDLRVDDVA